jgi:hypothetical protein
MSNRLLVAALAFLIAVSLAGTPRAEEDELYWGFGNVVSLDTSSKEISISEYDYESDAEETVTYAITDDTEYGNDMGPGDIKAGNEVSIEYEVDAKGRKVATYIDISDEEETGYSEE